MSLEDQTLTCRDCGQEFVWTTSEQQFYQDKGFTNAPVRCPECRRVHKQQKFSGGSNFGPRQMYDVTCSACGKPTQVPFQPRGDRPVYCSDCFRSRKS